MLEFSHDNNSMTYTSAELVSLLSGLLLQLLCRNQTDGCGDFKVTVNPSLSVDQYPLPKVDNLLVTLAGGQQFTKLDLTQAYLQLALHQDLKEYCTHRGLHRFNRLPFGIASAPALFQKTMESDTILQGIPGAMFPRAQKLWHTNEEGKMPLHA